MTVTMRPDCESIVAHLPGVRAYIRKRTMTAAGNAKRKLASHRDQGDSNITWEVRRTDGYVSLEDPDGGAMSIEFGRTGTMGQGSSQGVHALVGIW